MASCVVLLYEIQTLDTFIKKNDSLFEITSSNRPAGMKLSKSMLKISIIMIHNDVKVESLPVYIGPESQFCQELG